jgi:hypothetical protein
MSHAKPPPPSGRDGGSDEMSFEGDIATVTPNAASPQIKFQDPPEAEFDGEIALALTVTGWRVVAALLTHAAGCAVNGDFLNAERNRQFARSEFIQANDIFREFLEARRATADAIGAEAFR